MFNLLENAFECADILAGKKERAIEEALNHHFGVDAWDEHIAAEHCSIEYHYDGHGYLLIKGIPVLKFGPLETDVVISHKSVHLLFKQSITRLYI